MALKENSPSGTKGGRKPAPALKGFTPPVSASKSVISPTPAQTGASLPGPGPAPVAAKPLTLPSDKPPVTNPVAVEPAKVEPAKSEPGKPEALKTDVVAVKPGLDKPVSAPAAKVEAATPAPLAKPAPVAAPTQAAKALARPVAKPAPARAAKTPAIKAPAPQVEPAAKTAAPVAGTRSPVPPATSAQTIQRKDTTMTTLPTFDVPEAFKTAFADFQDKAKNAYEKSTASAADYSEFAKGNLEALVEAGKIFTAGLQELSTALVADSREALETLTSEVKTLASARTPTDFVQIQSDLLKKHFDKSVAFASKQSEAALKLAGETVAPISGRVSLAVDKIKAAA